MRFSLAPGASSGDIDLFDITLANPERNPLGTYSLTYGLLGGVNGGSWAAQDNLAQASFPVNATPEPPYGALLGIGLALGLAAWLAKKILAEIPGVHHLLNQRVGHQTFQPDRRAL